MPIGPRIARVNSQPSADPGERGAGDEQQRPRQDHRDKAARHPEVIRNNPDLVEEDQREGRQRHYERGIPPEEAARDQRVADEGRNEGGNGEIEVRKRPQGVRVVVRELAAGVPEGERVDGQQHDDDRERGGHDVHGALRHARRPSSGDEEQEQPAGPGAQRGVLPRRQVRQKDDRHLEVLPHRPHRVPGPQRRGDDERRPERPPVALSRHETEHRARDHGAHRHDGIEAQEQQQTEQDAGDGREKRIVIHVRARIRQQRREQERLHDDVGVGVAREPDLDDVEREQRRGGRRRRAAKQPRAEEIHRQHAEDAPEPHRAPRARQPVERVADRH